MGNIFINSKLLFTEKLKNKVVLITGGDSSVGRAVGILFARQGADIAIVYLNETIDAADKKVTRKIDGSTKDCYFK